MDTDLEPMTREELIAEVKKLRHDIRQHRDSTRHEVLASSSAVGIAA